MNDFHILDRAAWPRYAAVRVWAAPLAPVVSALAGDPRQSYGSGDPISYLDDREEEPLATVAVHELGATATMLGWGCGRGHGNASGGRN